MLLLPRVSTMCLSLNSMINYTFCGIGKMMSEDLLEYFLQHLSRILTETKSLPVSGQNEMNCR